MSWKMFLEIARKPNGSRLDEEMRRGVTIGRKAYIADLMLFDRSSLAEAQSRWDRFPERGWETYRILLSERTRAVECFRRRLPRVLEALSWHPVAVDTLPRFGKLFERIDWPYVMLETEEYRMNFSDLQTSDEFDRMLEFSVSAIDDRAMAALGNPFGGEGRYSPAWEKLLEFCFFPPGSDLCGRPKGAGGLAMGVTGFRQQVFLFVEDLPVPQPDFVQRTLRRNRSDDDLKLPRSKKIGAISAVGHSRRIKQVAGMSARPYRRF